MSYVSMTLYNIYSFLFIIVYIVCIIICFLRYCIFVLDKTSREKIVKTGGSGIILSDAIQNTVFSLAKIPDNTAKIYFISTDNVFLPS